MTELPRTSDELYVDSDSAPVPGSVEARNAWIDAVKEQINLGRISEGKKPLPDVTVKNRDTSGYPKPYAFTLHDPAIGNQYIGYLTLRPPVNGIAQELAVHIDEHYRHHQGYGIAIYLEAMKRLPEGIGMASDYHLSPDAYGMWRALEAAGVVTCNKRPDKVSPTQIEDIVTYKGVRFQTVFGGHPIPGSAQANVQPGQEQTL